MQIINKSKNTIIARKAWISDTVFSRLQGLLGREALAAGHALVITRCRSIHTFFMRFTIDVIFVDKNNKVVGLAKRIRPWRMSPYFFRSSRVVELPQGTIEETKTAIGDALRIA